MRLASWRKEINRAKYGNTLNDIDNDVTKALSEIPPMRLACIDEAFVLLDSGLGAIFSAGMARRAAVQRQTTRAYEKELKKTKLEEEQAGKLAASRFRRATMRIVAPIRRQAAQRATLKMVSDLVGPKTLATETEHRKSEEAKLTSRKSEEGRRTSRKSGEARHSSLKNSAIERKSRGSEQKKILPIKFISAPVISYEDDDNDLEDMDPDESEVNGIPAACQLGEDPGFWSWAEEQLQLSPRRLNGLEKTPQFRAKLGHQMLCWQALQANKLAPKIANSLSPTPRGLTNEDVNFQSTESSSCFASIFNSEEHSASTGASTKEPSVATHGFHQAAQSLFGLTRYLDAQTMRRSRTPTRAWNTGSDAAAESPGSASPEPTRKGPGPASTLERPEAGSPGEQSSTFSFTLNKRSVAPLDMVTSQARSPLPDTESIAERPSTRDSVSSRRLPSRGQTCEPPIGVALRRPPPFIEPHRDIQSRYVDHTPELLYLRRCEVQGLIPCPAVWRKFGNVDCSIIDASKRSLSDADVCAIVETAVECAAEGHELHQLNLSHNALTDIGVERFARIIAGPPLHCTLLTSLSLAGNTSLKFRSQDLLRELAELLTALPRLAELDLSGVPIHGHAASILCGALRQSSSLTDLNLSGCEVGRMDQSECTVAAELMGSVHRTDGSTDKFGLQRLDLSCNFFGRTGFMAAAAALRRSCLKSLSFASNCAGSSCHFGKDHAQFHPIQLLIEGLQFNTTLETLDLSDCSLGPDSAFVLEDALQAHSTLTSLDLSSNPLGDAGLRCILRLILGLQTDIHVCNVAGHREADVSSHWVKFRFTQPGGGYRLQLKYPHERATLRTLLRISEKATSNSFRYFKFDAKQAKPNIEKDPDTDRWMLPTHGTFSFTFQPPLSETALQYSIQQRAPGGSTVTTTSVSSQAAAAASAASALASHMQAKEERKMLLEQGVRPKHLPSSIFAASGDVPRFSQLPALRNTVSFARPSTSFQNPSRPSSAVGMNTSSVHHEIDWTEITTLLSSSRLLVSALRYPLVRRMFLSLITREQQARFIHACSKDMAFNGPQVSQLCEDRPEMAAQIIGALFGSIQGRTAQLLLLGGLTASLSPRVCAEVSPCLWFQEGNLTGRYFLDLDVPADYSVAENCLLVNAWESEVGRLMGRPDISQRGNYEMLRNESHNEVPFTFHREWALPSHGFFRLDYSSIRRPPHMMTAMPEAGEVTRYMQRTSASPQAKLRALRAVSVHLYLSSQQFRSLIHCFPTGPCRRDFFCLMHTRVVDRARLLSAEFLYSSTIFDPEDREALFHRIGHLHLLNPLHPEGMVFKCNLARYEERKVIDYLVQLRSKEPGGKVTAPLQDDDRHGPVPASWADKGVPIEETEIICGYETTHPNPLWRQALAEKYCVGQFQ